MIRKHTALAALAALAASAPAHAAVVISTAATQNMNCTGGTCVPTATQAVLNASDLENDLSQFGNVRVMTTGNGVEANNIFVRAAFSSPDSTSLTLDAYGAITIDAAVAIGSSTAELELQSGKGGVLGTLSFSRKGHVTFGSLSDIFGINGGIFTLVGSVQGLASAIASNPGGAYALANDYDASRDGTYANSPVSTALTGNVQGLGNTISRLSIKHHERVGLAATGLFETISSTGMVENLRLSKIRYFFEYNNTGDGAVGGLVGVNYGTLINNRVTGSIEGDKSQYCDEAGGLAGGNVGKIKNSSANVKVAACIAGGLVGMSLGTIKLSYAEGEVNCGRRHSNCYAGGGLVGYLDGSERFAYVEKSFATGPVNGFGALDQFGLVGGLVGFTQSGDSVGGVISNSYATGAVSGDSPGGFLGGVDDYIASNSLSDSYSIGAVTPNQNGDAGGFACGLGPKDGTDDYWDVQTSGTDTGICGGNVNGVTGLTTTQLQSGLPTGFDSSIWAENPNINGGLPYLIHNPPPH